MSEPTYSEKYYQHDLALQFIDCVNYENSIRNIEEIKISKLQEPWEADDCKADAILEFTDKNIPLEIRRKNVKNHKGKYGKRIISWDWLADQERNGPYINESVIRSHLNHYNREYGDGSDYAHYKGYNNLVDGLMYLVYIIGFGNPRMCYIGKERCEELLRQPLFFEDSFNSEKPQSVKYVPVTWFTWGQFNFKYKPKEIIYQSIPCSLHI